jgi:hypothetical protein
MARYATGQLTVSIRIFLSPSYTAEKDSPTSGYRLLQKDPKLASVSSKKICGTTNPSQDIMRPEVYNADRSDVNYMELLLGESSEFKPYVANSRQQEGMRASPQLVVLFRCRELNVRLNNLVCSFKVSIVVVY